MIARSFAIAILGLVIACNGAKVAERAASPQAAGQEPADQAEPLLPGMLEGPGGEIVPLAGHGVKLEGTPGLSGSGDRDELLDAARQALTEGRLDEAVALVDTLLILGPDDAEALEFRSKILSRQGHPEDAKVDRGRCCALGRQSCCPSTPGP